MNNTPVLEAENGSTIVVSKLSCRFSFKIFNFNFSALAMTMGIISHMSELYLLCFI